MHKLLIADSSAEIRQTLSDALKGRYILHFCSDGRETLAALRTFRPDLMLLDLMLPVMDGLSVLQQCNAENIRPVTLVTLDFHTSYIGNALSRLPVAYIMKKPWDLPSLLAHIDDLSADLQPVPMPAPVQQASPQAVAAAVLMALGFKAGLSGFRYLKEAIPLYASDPNQAITKELYVAVGERFGKHHKLVERSIRSAIERAWQTPNAARAAYFPAAPDGSVPRPSNGAFISQMANILFAESRKTA